MTNNYFLTKLYTYFVYNIFYIRKYENSGKIDAKIHKTIPEGSEFFVPTISQQLRFWVIQQSVR